MDISQNANTVVFCGTFDAKGCQTQVRAGRLEILQHGRIRKLVQNVAHITFSGQQALLRGQRVLYVTERATFELTADGVELIELAPGVELQRDVLSQMDFKRSEEHTSELQSLMRNSYAVFCLKKKT